MLEQEFEERLRKIDEIAYSAITNCSICTIISCLTALFSFVCCVISIIVLN